MFFAANAKLGWFDHVSGFCANHYLPQVKYN